MDQNQGKPSGEVPPQFQQTNQQPQEQLSDYQQMLMNQQTIAGGYPPQQHPPQQFQQYQNMPQQGYQQMPPYQQPIGYNGGVPSQGMPQQQMQNNGMQPQYLNVLDHVPAPQQQNFNNAGHARKVSAEGRKVIDRHGIDFMSEEDKKKHSRMTWQYKMGVAAMLTSFPLSFYYSRKISTDSANAMKYLRSNMGVSAFVTIVFCYSLYKRGAVEEEMAQKYLQGFQLHELQNFELNKFQNIQRIQQARYGGQQPQYGYLQAPMQQQYGQPPVPMGQQQYYQQQVPQAQNYQPQQFQLPPQEGQEQNKNQQQ